MLWVKVWVFRDAVVIILQRARNYPDFRPMLNSGLLTPCFDAQHLQDPSQAYCYVFVVEWGCYMVDLDCKCLLFVEKSINFCVWVASQKELFFVRSHGGGSFFGCFESKIGVKRIYIGL
jgi:hypothetical protein